MSKHVDVLVVGGGINGVGVAQFAAAAGFSVLLVDRGEIGGETSGNSSKLIHGGLRYLESFQLELVRKSLGARRDLLALAPKLVKPVRFYIPIYRHSQRGALTIRAGLSLYGLLSEFDPLGRFRKVPRSEWQNLDGLATEGLEAVFQYWDAQTDDRLLCQAVAHSANLLGAEVWEQSQVVGIRHHGDGCEIELLRQGQAQQVSAALVVNACGPWVNELLGCVLPPTTSLAIDWVQGSHLLLDIAPPGGIMYLESPVDKRVVFVMPWYGKTLVGTTETLLESLDSKPEITEAERRYLLALYSRYFPNAGSTEALAGKICGSFCGVRVLPKVNGDAFNAPRDTLMHTNVSHPRLLSIYGGKLTTFRASSDEVLNWIKTQLGSRPVVADVDKLILHAAPSRDDFASQTG
ncbi:glycerol-3-phosphate dehydrogenase/oxidase [Shewanella sp.]|uniref:glycerol-3-phosphate dehydrogenase/oxidase n=1 Tax=Shewanella sp. TaxID=50422 RepID=UPI003566611D